MERFKLLASTHHHDLAGSNTIRYCVCSVRAAVGNNNKVATIDRNIENLSAPSRTEENRKNTEHILRAEINR